MQISSSSSVNNRTQNRRARRRKVADDIQEQQPEGVKSLLAALEKAQKGKSESVSKEAIAKTHKQETKKQTVGARVARSRHESVNQQIPSSRTNNTNTNVSAGSSKFYNPGVKNKSLPQKVRIPSDVLDDLIFRFIEHIPLHEKFVNTRLCFQVELAHWFYVDYYVNKEMSCRTDCPNMTMREFSWSIFSHSPEHKHMARNVDDVLDEWRHYKSNVPTYGAILLDSTLTKVVLVQGFYSSKNSWGFPKGKVNEDEDPRDCAAREVYEETGYDFKDEANRLPISKEFKIQKFINDTMVRLYVITDVPTDFNFAPKTRNEIRDIQWFNVSDLPTDKNDQRTGPLSNNNFYTVIPFVQDLQNYVKKELQRRAKTKVQPPQQAAKKVSAEFMDSLSQANANPGTHGKIENTPNVLFNLFNSFLSGNNPADPPLKSAPFSSPALTNLGASSVQKATLPVQLISSANSAFSPFKPVEENIAQSLLNIVKPQKPQNPHLVAHPIAIPGRPKLTPLSQNAQGQRPTPPKPKIGASETSAFKAIPKNKSSSSLNDSDSIFGSEIALDQCGIKDPLLSASMNASFDSDNFHVQLCEAWKSFKLDVGSLLDTPVFYR